MSPAVVHTAPKWGIWDVNQDLIPKLVLPAVLRKGFLTAAHTDWESENGSSKMLGVY